MFSDFIVEKVVEESSNIKSFYLKPKDDVPLKYFKPGQYVAIRLNLPDHSKPIIRNYSFSDQPGLDYYRITIKIEEDGLVSKLLYNSLKKGDFLELSIPLGKFHLNDEESVPLVLISGGVGITPMLSMLEYVLHQQTKRDVYFIHSSRNKSVQAMHPRLKELHQENDHLSVSIFHSQPLEEEIEGVDYDEKGKITKAFIQSTLSSDPACYFLCGSLPFMQSMFNFLVENGANPASIKYEFFGVGRIDTKSAVLEKRAKDNQE